MQDLDFRFDTILQTINTCPYSNIVSQLVSLCNAYVTMSWPQSKVQAKEERNIFVSPKIMEVVLTVFDRYIDLSDGEVAVRNTIAYNIHTCLIVLQF